MRSRFLNSFPQDAWSYGLICSSISWVDLIRRKQTQPHGLQPTLQAGLYAKVRRGKKDRVSWPTQRKVAMSPCPMPFYPYSIPSPRCFATRWRKQSCCTNAPWPRRCASWAAHLDYARLRLLGSESTNPGTASWPSLGIYRDAVRSSRQQQGQRSALDFPDVAGPPLGGNAIGPCPFSLCWRPERRQRGRRNTDWAGR